MYTTQQLNAINTRDKTLLVSAGAGSGKTTVLTRRLIERIKAGDSVTDFLVVTFMKAAAADVKRKLYDALVEESALNPENKHLYRQTQLVSEANICTISSYCLSLVKENFPLLGISPRVRVIDETESALLLRRVTDELIKKGYDEENPWFLLLADNFSGEKSDDSLAEKMIKLYNTLSVTLNRRQMLEKCEKELRTDAELTENQGFFASNCGKEIQSRISVFYKELLDSAIELHEYASHYADDKYMSNIIGLLDICQDVYDAVGTNYVNYNRAATISLSTPGLRSGKCDEDAHEYIKDVKGAIAKELANYQKRYGATEEKLIAQSFEKCADIVRAINFFLNDMEKEFMRTKMEINALDYTDFELFALKLLETTDENGISHPTELCLKKQSSFKEILIDEYQDVNPLQDKLFQLLSGKSHRFMVGDVKQSIYRFRNAYPDIFLGYKSDFPQFSPDDKGNSACIFLRENFRCSETVINYVNHVFDLVTQNTMFRSEYEDEWLIYPDSKKNPIDRGMEFPVVVAIAEKEKDLAEEARRDEAEYIASEIRRLVHNETDSKGESLKYSDFAVMLGAMKGFSIPYEKAFRKYGVPYKTSVSTNFLDNPVINLAVSALKAIDDSTDDISMCALLRSPICKFTSQDLYRIRVASPVTNIYSALTTYSLSKAKKLCNKRYNYKKRIGAKTHLVSRCKEFMHRIGSWRNENTGVPCREFLKSFFVSSGLMRIAAEENRQSLLLLYEYATKYETSDNYGLSGFLDYLNELSASGKEISDAANVGDEDAVSFITVHKSKGLEFKVCFLAGTDKEFKGLKDNSEINFRRGSGVFFKLHDPINRTVYNPVCNILACEQEKDQMRGEELRKLYVALTRAKERLYVTGCIEPEKLETQYTTMTAHSWLEWILNASKGECSFFDVQTIEKASGRSGYISSAAKKVYKATKEMADIINYRYPYLSSVTTATKISVSELREGLLEDDEYNRTKLSIPASRVAMRPAFAGEETIGAAEIGTANHLFMQFCNFNNAELSVIAEAKRLCDIKMITETQMKMLDIPALENFFKSELYQRIKASNRVYREKRFSVKNVLDENSEPILIQGVIDCFFQNPDGSFTVVDYKTDRVKSFDELASRHKIQLECYKNAVEGMTNCPVTQVLLYSFHLGGEVSVK